MHTHTYSGQKLTHDHPGGDQEHGYFGHTEDEGSPDFGDGTYEYLGETQREGGPTSFDPATAQLRLDQAVARLARFPRAAKDAELACILGCLGDELTAAKFMRPVYQVTHAAVEDMAGGREVSAEEFARIAMAIEFDPAVRAAVRQAVGTVIDLADGS